MLEKNVIINGFLILGAIADFILFFWILKNSERKESHIAFGITSLCVGLWTLGIALFRMTDKISMAYFWNREFVFTAGVIPATLVHFSYLFTQKKAHLSLFKKILVYLPSLVILIAVFIPNALIKDIVVREWGKESILGLGYIYYGGYFSIFVGIVFYFLFKTYFSSSGIFKMQLRYVILALLPSMILGSFFNLYLILMGDYRFIWIGPYASFIFVVLNTYGITKHRLMDVRLAFRGGLVFVSYLVGVLILFVPFVLWLRHVPIFLVAITILLAIISPFAYRFLTRISRQAVDKTIFKGRFDYLDKLRQEAESSQPLHTSSEVAERMVEGISSAMNVENCSFMMYNSWRNQFRPKAHKGLKGVLGDYQIMPGITWEVTEPIVRFLVNKKRALVKEEITTSPSKENIPIMDAMTKIHAAVAVPIFIEYKLIGILGIGRKNTGDMFDTTDLKLLSQLAKTLERDLSHTYFMEERTVFSSKVAHDLRSPFNWIMNNLSNMNVGVYGEISEEQRKELSKVFEGMRLLERNIREFFNLNVLLQQVTHGEYRVAKGDIGMLIKNVGDRFKPVLEKQGLGFAVELPSNIPKVIMNAEDIEQHVLGNLITNALKYTNKGKITLGVEVVVAGVICKVQDTGIGIPKHALPHVLKPFFHLHTAGEDKQTGVGLGLVIVKEVVEANGGRVWVESVEGKGATFYFTLPIA